MIGSGPNGLAAAVLLAQAGLRVEVHEAAEVAGGATRSGELTLPGFIHDLGSAVHPWGVSSPFFSELPLAQHGLQWVWPSASLAHPFDDGTALTVERKIDDTAGQLGADGDGYKGLYEPMVANWPVLVRELLRPIGVPHHLPLMTKFGLNALQSCTQLANRIFRTDRARALCGVVRAFGVAIGSAYLIGFRDDAERGGARGGLADCPGRLADDCKRFGQFADKHGRTSDYAIASGGAFGHLERLDVVRRHATPVQPAGWNACAEFVPPDFGTVSLRTRRIQSGLGAEGADSLEGERMRAIGHCSPGRNNGGDSGIGTSKLEPRRARTPVCFTNSAHFVRPKPRAGGTTHRVGLLPRSKWLGRINA